MLKRNISLFIIIVMVLSTLAGCSGGVIEEETNATDEQVLEVAEELETGQIEIEDMAGRTITLSKTADKVFATSPTGTILLYTLNPEKMIGWNYDLKEGEKRFILEECHSLPSLGGAGKNAINIEELLKLDPDVIIIMEESIEASLLNAEEIEQQTGKPTIIVESNLRSLDKVYEVLGKVIGEEVKAKELSEYCRETMEDVLDKASTISDDEKIGVYYAEGPNGLETEPSGSWHVEIIDLVGGRNVAEVELKGDYGKSEVSIEQLLKWDPDIILSWDDERGGYYSEIFKDPVWQDITAVKNEEVYEIPNRPFNWFDRPPSVNRILGIRWVGSLLYPEIFDYDMEEEVKEFYDKFYHYQLSQEEIKELLENSIRQ